MLSARPRGSTVTLCGPEGDYSRYDPRRPFTGKGWDAQSAAGLLAGQMPRRILLLGLGGGTTARQLRLMFPAAELVGVEIDPAIVALAVAHCGLRGLGVEVVVSSGEQFLARCSRCFDLIIDDMWDHEQRRPRSVCVSSDWAVVAAAHLSEAGVFAANLYARREDREAYDRACHNLRLAYPAVWEVRVVGEVVTVLAGVRAASGARRRGRLLRQLPPAAQRAMARVRFCERTRDDRESTCSSKRNAA